MRTLYSFLILIFISSCTPINNDLSTYHVNLKIVNNCDSTIICVIEKSGDFATDSIQFAYQYNDNCISHIIGDTFMVTTCTLNQYDTLLLNQLVQPISMYLIDKQEALSYIQEIADTLYLKKDNLLKTLYDYENWIYEENQTIDGNDIVDYIFTISDNDILVDVNYNDYMSSDSIQSNFKFYPDEVCDNYNAVDTPRLILNIKSTIAFPHINNEIATSNYFINNEVIIRFDSIIENSGVAQPGTASKQITLPENISTLTFINGFSIDKYDLSINDQKIEIYPINQNFTDLKFDKLFRYPKNSFVYSCGMDTSEISIYENFLNILNSNLSISEFEFIGEGRVPYPTNFSSYNRISLNNYFEYDNESEFHKALQLLRDFVLEHKLNTETSVDIRLISWNNQQGLSWMIKE